MIGLEDRQTLARDIEAAQLAGARLEQACEVAGIDERSLQRWKADQGLVSGDGRPNAVRPTPSHALTPAERERILQVANEPRFADIPLVRIDAAGDSWGCFSALKLMRIHRCHIPPVFTHIKYAVCRPG